jgi:pimeloyl-ACP methyl ester carboxylesterase
LYNGSDRSRQRKNELWLSGAVSDFVMASDKTALVLLHGGAASGRAWQDVVPLVSAHHEVYTPTAPGHRGGPPVHRHPATAPDLVEWAERYLDEHGLQRPHLVGHSLGGYMAIELARRGRAATVCAFAPGGFWGFGDGLRAKTMSRVGGGIGIFRLVRPVMPLVMKSSTVRRLWFQVGARHGDRVSSKRGVEIFDDFVGCTVSGEFFSTDDEQIGPLDPLPCPITVAWSENDGIIPLADYGPNARERLPYATFVILPDTGHDPMMDDPGLVARTILTVTGANA